MRLYVNWRLLPENNAATLVELINNSMNYCHRCGLPATYYIESREKWACDKSAQKCPTVKSKIGKSNSIALTGKKLSDEHKSKIAVGITGRILSNESKEKIRQSNIDHWAENKRIPWNKGKPGLQVAWNRGKKKLESLEIISREDPVYSNFRKYRNRVAVRTRKTYELFKNEINPNNHPLGKCGIDGAYQLDHIITVRLGFEQGLLIEDISAKDNLQVIPWLENVKKYDGKGLRK